MIELVRRLQREAPAAGGEVGALLGNHELHLLAADRFGARPVDGLPWRDGLHGAWLAWGGIPADLAGLTDDQRRWLRSLPAAALVGGCLLLHSDTAGYLRLGASVEAVNAAVAAELDSSDPLRWFALMRVLHARQEFRAEPGREVVRRVLGALGGDRVVHGHSPLPSFFGVPPGGVRGPVVYAGGLAVAVDGGVHEGGRVLVADPYAPFL